MNVNAKIIEVAKNIWTTCMGAKPGEKLLVVADDQKLAIGYAFVMGAREIGLDCSFVECAAQTKGEPPAFIADAMSLADAELVFTSMSYSHTLARVHATKKGVRIATLPLITEEICEKYMNADYNKVYEASANIAKVFTAGKLARITSDSGCDLTIDIEGREAMIDAGQLQTPGAFGNLPAGEGLIAPLENGANGVYVAMPGDCISYLGYVKDKTTLTIKNGYIQRIDGGQTADELVAMLADKDGEAKGIAELAIGTNPVARLIGHPLLDEKVLGTCHIAFGFNKSITGGERASNIHYDIIINGASVEVDGIRLL